MKENNFSELLKNFPISTWQAQHKCSARNMTFRKELKTLLNFIQNRSSLRNNKFRRADVAEKDFSRKQKVGYHSIKILNSNLRKFLNKTFYKIAKHSHIYRYSHNLSAIKCFEKIENYHLFEPVHEADRE